MRLLFTWLCVALFCFSAVAQSLKISGTVTDAFTRGPMLGVLVTIRPGETVTHAAVGEPRLKPAIAVQPE